MNNLHGLHRECADIAVLTTRLDERVNDFRQALRDLQEWLPERPAEAEGDQDDVAYASTSQGTDLDRIMMLGTRAAHIQEALQELRMAVGWLRHRRLRDALRRTVQDFAERRALYEDVDE